MKKIDKVLKIYDLLEIGEWNIDSKKPIRSFGLSDDSLNVINILEFDELINSLYEEENEIFRSFSHKVFVGKLIAFIGKFKVESSKISESEVKAFFQELKNSPLLDYSIYREIFGITINQDKKITVGNFEISPFSLIKKGNLKESKYYLDSKQYEPQIMIKYNVKARDRVRALELADEAFKKFILFLRYIIGTSNKRFEVGILHFSGFKSRKAFIHSSDGNLSVDSACYGYSEAIPLDDLYFVNSAMGYDKVWSLIDKKKSKLEQRLATAIEWLGRSLEEDAIQAAFIEASIALEAIFTYSEKSIVSPSILSQISESTALLLGKNVNDRLEIEKQMKQLYSIRSGVVHAGSKEVSEESYSLFVSYIRNVITKLLVSHPYNSCSTIEDLYEELKKIKYGA